MTPGEARERFVQARVAHLATVDAAGAPHIVPITFALEGDSLYTAVDAKPKRATPLRRFANVAANARVSVLVDRTTRSGPGSGGHGRTGMHRSSMAVPHLTTRWRCCARDMSNTPMSA